MNILAQVIGGIGILIWIVSIQRKNKSDILIYQGIANIFIAIQYFILGVYTPALIDVSTSARSFIFSGYSKKDKSIPIIWLFIFLLITIFFGIVSWSGFLALIPIINTGMYVISTWLKDTKWLRIFYVVAALFFIYYNFSVGAYIMLVGNSFEVISGIYSIIKYNKN